MSDDERKHLEGLDEATERQRWEDFHSDSRDTMSIELTRDEIDQIQSCCNRTDCSGTWDEVAGIVAARVAEALRDAARRGKRDVMNVPVTEPVVCTSALYALADEFDPQATPSEEDA